MKIKYRDKNYLHETVFILSTMIFAGILAVFLSSNLITALITICLFCFMMFTMMNKEVVTD